jgi:MFS family permease
MLNSCINGYDGSLMGSVNSYRQYREYFGFDLEEGTPTTGIVYAIYTIGNIVGSFFAGPFTDFRGTSSPPPTASQPSCLSQLPG